ncbi:4-(cytidine 5'-diphospho)-2-C-methyl-D-erythritol kinase [Desulforudis sp. 1088]|uniref:4-(cytidine 5'-diphospho)-2-C-methyl-D-erythritol kinase n=1 Tax=unclassified Candidatus Desulforudis TaxID=2635950 RepID=UPI00346FF247
MVEYQTVRVEAHAKINLSLDVVGVLPDGYHRLETVMQRLALHDILEFAPLDEEIVLVADGAEVPAGEDNLVVKAARLLARTTGCRLGARILLEKRIPVSAGLGGGSADAAATLAGLNRLWRLGLEMGQLLGLASGLGADVPFCLAGRTAFAEGKGDVLTELAALPAAGVLLVKPPFGVSTTQVYAAYDSGPRERLSDARRMVEAVESGSLERVAACLGNDLEQVTLTRYPELAAIKRRILATGALGALMAGSGPTVFGLYRSAEDARKAATRFEGDLTVIATQTL